MRGEGDDDDNSRRQQQHQVSVAERSKAPDSSESFLGFLVLL